MMRRNHLLKLLILLVSFLFINVTHAHRMGESYLFVDYANQEITWDVEARLFDELLSLDTSNNGIVSWPEYRQALPSLTKLLNEGLILHDMDQDAKPIQYALTPIEISDIDQGTYLSTRLILSPAQLPQNLRVDYSPLMGLDPAQTLLIKIQTDSLLESIIPISKDQTNAHVSQSRWFFNSVVSLFNLGFLHMFAGLDHGVFILLLTTAVLFSSSSLTLQKDGSLPALPVLSVVKTTGILVTFFSLGHGVSLLFSTLFKLSPPSYWIELAIALTIVITAMQHLWRGGQPKAMMVFLFGTIHGFGFASSLSALSFATLHQIIFVTSFNLGIEIAQILVAALCLISLRVTRLWPTIYCKISLLIYSVTWAIGMYWIIARL